MRLDKLPLFPLGIVLFPGERLPLHLFEPRYRAMAADVLETDAPFGLILSEDGTLADVGCTARIERVINRYDDGRLDVLVRGERRFRLGALYEGEKPYVQADVELIEEPEEPLDNGEKERAITQHIRLLELAGRTVRPSLYENVAHVSFVLAHNAGLSLRQKQDVLELPSENDRIGYLTLHMEKLLPRVEQVEAVRKKVQSNGHFKDFPPESL